MAERSALFRCTFVVMVAATIAGCGAPPPPPVLAPAPQPLSAAEIDIFARLLELEDRREYDVWSIGPAAAESEVTSSTILKLVPIKSRRLQGAF